MRQLQIAKPAAIILISLLFVQTKAATLNLADTVPSTINLKSQYYLDLAKRQTVTRDILRYSGGAVCLIGCVMFLNEFDETFMSSPEKKYNNLGEIICYTGLAIAAASIPFWIAANKNKKKAKLILSGQDVSIIQPFQLKQTAFSLTVRL